MKSKFGTQFNQKEICLCVRVCSVRERRPLKKAGNMLVWPTSPTTSPSTGWTLPGGVDGSGNWSANGLGSELSSRELHAEAGRAGETNNEKS